MLEKYENDIYNSVTDGIAPMKEYRLLIFASLIASIGWVANKFFDGILLQKVCNGAFCFTPFDAFVAGILVITTTLIILFIYD